MPIKKFYNDTETTGTDPKRHGIIQWTGIMFIDGKEVDRIDLAIRPFPEDVIEDEALEANGITREELASPDRLTPKEAYRQIVKFLGKHIDKFNKKDKAFWVGYNAKFDGDMTREFFAKNGDVYFGSWFWMPILDIMSFAGFFLMKLRHTLPNFKLKTVFDHLYPDKAAQYDLAAQEGEDPWHDSLFDVERTIDVEAAFRKMVGENIQASKQ